MTDLRHIFSAKGDHGLYLYRHKHEEALLKEAKRELARCETGAHQLKIVNVQEIDIKVIKSNEQMKFVPSGHTIYIAVPGEMTHPNAEFILDLAMAIREAEQFLLGYTPPDLDEDPEKYSLIYHTRQLDLIVHMFKIADELQKTEKSEVFLDKIENYGYGYLYKLYKEDVSNEELIDLYLENIDQS